MTDDKLCKSIVENVLKNNGIKWEIKNFGKYIDPKCKTANSIYYKLFRLFSDEKNRTTYSVIDSKIDDLLRMTIIVDYSKVTSTIQVLKQNFPDLTGYMQIEKAGYRGIHLNLKIDGIPCEIQLTPKIVAMAVDYLHTLYEKWRNFDFEKELLNLEEKETEILKSKIDEQKKLHHLNEIFKRKNALELKKQEEANDFILRNKVYGEIYNIAEFLKYKDEIKEQIEKINNNKNQASQLTDMKLLNILNKNLLTNGQLDKNKVQRVAELISQNIKTYQDKLVFSVKESLNI